MRPGCRAIGPGAGPLAQWPGLMQVVTVAGIVGAIAIDATAGWLHGFWPVAVIVIASIDGAWAAAAAGAGSGKQRTAPLPIYAWAMEGPEGLILLAGRLGLNGSEPEPVG